MYLTVEGRPYFLWFRGGQFKAWMMRLSSVVTQEGRPDFKGPFPRATGPRGIHT